MSDRTYHACEYCGNEMFEHFIGPHEEMCATRVWAVVRKDGPPAWWSTSKGWVEFEDATTFTSARRAAVDRVASRFDGHSFAASINGNWHEVYEPTDDLVGADEVEKWGEPQRGRSTTDENDPNWATRLAKEAQRMHEPKDSIIQRMSALAADAREGLEQGNNEALWDMMDVVEEFLAAHEIAGETERERGVIVVFDVTSKSHKDAARVVASCLFASDVVGHEGLQGTIESWWFPEADVKDVDGNDNADMTLVRRDVLQQLVDAYEGGDAEWLGNVVHRLKGQTTGHAL